MGLTAAEIAQWNDDGYVIIRNALHPSDLAPMIAVRAPCSCLQ